MAITLNTMFKAIYSNKYDKKNIAVFVILMIAVSAVYIAMPANSFTTSIACLSAFILLTFIQSGYYAITSHNEIIQKEQVFPATTDFIHIIKHGIKYFIGITAILIIGLTIPTIIMLLGIFGMTLGTYVMPVLSPILGILIFIVGIASIFVVSYYFIIPLNVLFFQTLELKSLFDFEKAKVFRTLKKKNYKSYFFKLLLLGFLIYIIGGIIAVIFTVCGQDYLSTLPKEVAKENIQIVSSISALILQSILMPNLHGQIINSENNLNVPAEAPEEVPEEENNEEINK